MSARGKRGKRAASAAFLMATGLALALGACAGMPLKEGPRARLLPGIERPRDRHAMNILIYFYPMTAWPACIAAMAERGAASGLLAIVNVYRACAFLPRDDQLEPGEPPRCKIHVPENAPDLLEHELRHCEGWDHPAPVQFPARAPDA